MTLGHVILPDLPPSLPLKPLDVYRASLIVNLHTLYCNNAQGLVLKRSFSLDPHITWQHGNLWCQASGMLQVRQDGPLVEGLPCSTQRMGE